jgi:hypothetical protein
MWHWLGHVALAGVAFLGFYTARRAMTREDEALAVNQRARNAAIRVCENSRRYGEPLRIRAAEEAAETILKALGGQPVGNEPIVEDLIPW